MLEVLSKPGARDPEYVLSAVVNAVGGVKAADREKQRAATIGTAIHAGIEWQLRTRLGEDAGPEPVLPDAAAWAVESWKDWAKSIALEPLAVERTVYCEACGYAGTLDLYARVEGALTVLDWKSGRAIYPEAFLQNVAYRHAAERQGLPSTQGLIVRVPKLVDDPSWEVNCHGYWSQVRRPDATAYDCEETYFRDVLGLASWRTAYKRLAIGRMLLSFGEPERAVLRSAIAEIGLAKAAVIAPAIERFGEWKAWLQVALQCSAALLQARVSEALDALPRGR